MSKSPFWNYWFPPKTVSPNPVPMPIVNAAGLPEFVVWNVTVYEHTVQKHAERAAELVAGSKEKNAWDRGMKHQVGRFFVMVIPSEVPTASERRAAGLQPWEMIYTNRYLIPLKDGLSVSERYKEAERFAQALQAEGKSVNLYNPEQPYVADPSKGAL